MRTRSSLLVVLLASGCDQLFQLDHITQTRDGGGGGDGGGDGGATRDASGCLDPAADIALPLVADTWLATTAQGLEGDLIAINGSHILLTFDTLGYDIASLTLTLTARIIAQSCSNTPSTCTTCSRGAGKLGFYRSRTDWDQATATVEFRDGSNRWGSDAATGNEDRVDPIEESFDALEVVHHRSFEVDDVDPFADPAHISFHIETSGATAWFYSRESQKCSAADPVAPPTLTIRCR